MRTLLLISILTLAGSIARATEPTSKDIATGQKLYVGKCARCHKFYDPAAYDAEQWNTWMTKMRRKARLDETQYVTLSRYLETVRDHGTMSKQ